MKPLRAALVLAALVPGPAWAEAVVLSSTAPGMSVGRVLADDEKVRLPEATLTTLLLADGRLLKLNGPVEARAGDLAAGPQTASVAGGGFSGMDLSALGGTRGELAALPPPPRPDHVAVDVRRPGTWCLSPGASVDVVGQGVVDKGGSKVTLAPGRPWPAELPIRDGSRYVIDGSVPIAFHVVEDGPDAAFRLARAGCLAQVAGYLREAGQKSTPFALYLTTDRGQAPRYAIGEPVTVILQANRPARLACALVKDGGTTRLFADWIDLADHQELRIPGDRVTAEVAATPPPGMAELRCRAVEAGVATALPPVEQMELVSAPETALASAHLYIRVQ